MSRGVYIGDKCIADATVDNVTYTSDGKIDTICGHSFEIKSDTYINKMKSSDEDDSVLRFGKSETSKYIKQLDVDGRLAIQKLYRDNMNDLIDRFGSGLIGGGVIGGGVIE